jgi:hypothetical protein
MNLFRLIGTEIHMHEDTRREDNVIYLKTLKIKNMDSHAFQEAKIA